MITKSLHLVKPDWFFTLEMLGSTWHTVSSTMTRFRRVLRERLDTHIEDAYFVEPYANGQHHAHVLATGPITDTQWLYDAAIHAGTRVGALDPITHHGRLGYGLKMTETDEGLTAYLDANNGTLVHASRGFWKRPGEAPPRGGYRVLASQLRPAPISD